METVLHRDGDQFALVTSAASEDQFRSQLVEALDTMIEEGRYDGDWTFNLEAWLALSFEIILKYRGYKANVIEQRTLIAGHVDPDVPIISVGRQVEDAVAAA